MLQPKITKQQEDEFEKAKNNDEGKEGDSKKQDQNSLAGEESNADPKSKQ